MRQVLAFTVMLAKAYVRDRTAMFFSLLLPLLFMLIFGALNFGSFGHVTAGVVDEAQSAESARFIDGLRQGSTMTVETGDLEGERAKLQRGDRDMIIVIPADFRIAPAAAGATVPTLTVYENEGRGQQVAVGEAILTQVVDRISFQISRTSPVVNVARQPLSARNLRYVDFLVPGILGMNVMQLAVFSVAFGLVAQKQRGVLRRIMATPIRPARFLAAHVLMRLALAVAQVLILLGVAVILFKVTIVGSVLAVLALTTLGSILFLTIGFTLAGWATTEDQVPPIANLITLPQFFLSGVFFSRDAVPDLIRPISNVLPLTFLNDSVREVATQGATLWDVRGDVLGMAVWCLVGFALAVRFFRFES